MFAQVVQGRTSDPQAVRTSVDRWVEELAPGASGWLGTTAGVTEDGQLVVVARFESEEAARRNAARPEQDAFWRETGALLDGERTVLDSTEVDVETVGDPDRAGFVQVVQGRTTDPARARRLMQERPLEAMKEFRPEILGFLLIGHDEGRWTQVVYFASEAEARQGERREPPPEWRATMQELMGLSVGEPTFLDLRDPVLVSPR
jgi:hypothetical protein